MSDKFISHQRGAQLEYPYVVVRWMAAIYSRIPILVRQGGLSLKISTHECELRSTQLTLPDGTLTPSIRRLLIEQVQLAVQRLRLRMCIVWAKQSCTFVESDAVHESDTPPWGGTDPSIAINYQSTVVPESPAKKVSEEATKHECVVLADGRRLALTSVALQQALNAGAALEPGLNFPNKLDVSSELLTAEELAQRLQLPIAWIREATEKTRIPSYKFGEDTRYSLAGVLTNNAYKRIHGPMAITSTTEIVSHLNEIMKELVKSKDFLREFWKGRCNIQDAVAEAEAFAAAHAQPAGYQVGEWAAVLRRAYQAVVYSLETIECCEMWTENEIKELSAVARAKAESEAQAFKRFKDKLL